MNATHFLNFDRFHNINLLHSLMPIQDPSPLHFASISKNKSISKKSMRLRSKRPNRTLFGQSPEAHQFRRKKESNHEDRFPWFKVTSGGANRVITYESHDQRQKQFVCNKPVPLELGSFNSFQEVNGILFNTLAKNYQCSNWSALRPVGNCNCQNSNCQNKYCQCRKNHRLCSSACKCCHSKTVCSNSDQLTEVDLNEKLLTGCNCCHQNCLKKYCLCKKMDLRCTEACSCKECLN